MLMEAASVGTDAAMPSRVSKDSAISITVSSRQVARCTQPSRPSSGDTRRRRHHSSSVMPLGVERSSQANAVTPGCGRGLSYCNADNSRSSMTHAAPAASVLFRLGTLVLMPVKIHPGWAPPDRFLLWRILSLRQLEHGHGWQNPISTQHHCFDGNNK